MAVLPGNPYRPEIWPEYRRIGCKFEAEGLCEIATKLRSMGALKRSMRWLQQAEWLYTNLILKKGVVK